MSINNYSANTGRIIKENDAIINMGDFIADVGDFITDVYDVTNSAIKQVNLSFGSDPSATSTRPNNTTPYVVGQVVGTNPATSMEFVNAGRSANANIIIIGASLRIDAATIPSGMSSFRLHLYKEQPTGIADGAAYNLPTTDRDKYLGFIDLPAPSDIGDTLYCELNSINKKLKLGTSSMFAILETKGAYTPTAQVVKVVTLRILEV